MVFKPVGVDENGHFPERVSTALSAAYGPAAQVSSSELKAAFSRRILSGGFELKNPWPTVHPSPPVVAHATSKASSGTQQTLPSSSPRLRTYGDPGTINLNDGGKSATAATIAGYEFTIEGSTYVEITWYESVANAHRVWIWLDGQPITAAPVATIATGTGTRVFTHITLPDNNRHEIRFYGGEIGGIGNVYAPVTAAIAPTPPRLKLLWVGDSYSDGTTHCHETLSHPFTVARMLNMELGSASVGSMGYTSGAQPMSHQTRIDRAQRFNADLLVFDGSVNDASTITKAEIKAVWDAYLAVSPNAQGIVVFGVQSSSATSTLTAARATVNKTLKDAATEHPSVLAYFDMVGNADTGTVPAAWSSATTYAKGNKVTYLGSIWAATNTKATATTAPGTSADWALLSDGFFGTGQVGTTANNGTRDIVLASDGVHPTPIGANMLANNRATHLLNALRGLA